MLETFSATVNQIILMFAFMLLGYLMNKKHLGGDNFSAALSALEVNICLPALSFLTFSQNFTSEAITTYMPFLIAGVITMVVAFFMAKGLSALLSENSLQRDVLIYSFLIPNIGYMGYPIVSAVFGEDALLAMMVYTIPFNMMIYTYGLYILNPNREWSLKKLFNPNILAIALGIVCGLTRLRMPTVIENIIISAKACMSPLAMLLSGYVLGSVYLKPAFLDLKSYISAFLRAIVIPMAALGILLIFNIHGLLMTIIVSTLCMPFGLNSVVFPEAFGGDSKTGAKTCLISNVMSLITIPVVFAITQLIA